MAAYYGDIHLGDTIDFAFTTTSASTGAPTTLSGVPVLSAYVGSSTTELTAGITLTVDFDTRTGMNHVTVVATSGNGYTAATNVDIVITTGTVGGTSAVGYVVGSFSIDKRGVNQILGTAVSTPATAGVLDVNAKNINNVATTSVTTINANQGTTQPLNFTGAAGSALVKGDTIDVGGTAQTARDLGASVLLSAGTGTGQLDFTSGVVKANLAQILATALTETAGQLAGGFKKFFNIATPAATMDHLILVDTATTVTNQLTAAAIATGVWQDATAGDFTTASSIGKSLYTTGNAPGAASGLALVGSNMGTVSSVTGAVGSVTGAVGSVTGNVGGNVVGSVGSISGITFPTNFSATLISVGGAVTVGTLNAGVIDAASLATAAKTAISDNLLDRDMSTGTDSGTNLVRTVRQALRVLRNKVDTVGGTVYKEDDATSSWTFTVTTAAGNPITVVDPT